ncbi:MAG: LysE family transporter [Flavobacteriaceae bacterium]|jgi:threonine/homoserine/homoserine lactone efflux protein|nr:LysE family transporter [Flavobacteriaceae bacterium]MDG2314735.1 LysE family transporter [Flavobacteriaceae bacterium]
MSDFWTALPVGFFLSFTLGPVFFVLLETSITKGIRSAIFFNLGVILADIVFIAIAYFSTNQLLTKIKDDPSWLAFGGVLLASYGCITFIQTIKEKKKQPQTNRTKTVKKTNYLTQVLKGFFLNLINIGVLLFWLGIILLVGPKLEMNSVRITTFFIMVLSIYFLIDLIKISIAKQLKHKLTPSRIFNIKQVVNTFLFICGLVLIFQGFFPKEKEKIKNAIQEIRIENK